jgi:hypothetical protein
MLHYKISKKSKPKGNFIHFNQKNSQDGIINFSDMKKLSVIEDISKVVVADESIEINFPIYDHYYTLAFKSKNGWTLKKLIAYIYKTGMSAGEYLIKYQPNVIKDIATPEEFINNFALLSDKKKSDIVINNTAIYINLHDTTLNREVVEPEI